MIRALVIITPKQAAEISRTDVAFPRQFFEGPQSRVVLLNVLPTLLVSLKGARFVVFNRTPRVSDLHQHALQQPPAKFRIAAGVARAAGDQFIKQSLRRMGGE